MIVKKIPAYEIDPFEKHMGSVLAPIILIIIDQEK